MENEALVERLADTITLLSIPGIGRGRFHKLVASFGTPRGVLEAPISKLETVPGVSHSTASEIKNSQDLSGAMQVAARVVELGWTVLFPDSPEFPRQLLTIPDGEIPPVLFTEGPPISADEKMIAIVGTRHPTEQGRMFAYNLASQLAQAGVTVVSGMAEGIDAAAHKGAVDAGGRTVAVWGSSLDIPYPPSNKELAESIKVKGTLVSEYFPNTAPDRPHFPERNRLIAGLSDGVVVVEAGKKSGALITASQALAQGRELFAVPGSPASKMSNGANELIKRGARLVTSVEDIFEELPRLKGAVLTGKIVNLPDLTDTERTIVQLFSDGPLQVDHISRQLQIPVTELMEYLLALELKGVLRELSGKRFILSEEYI